MVIEKKGAILKKINEVSMRILLLLLVKYLKFMNLGKEQLMKDVETILHRHREV